MSKVLWNSDIDVYNSQVIPLSIARNICKNLSIPDLITFAAVSRNTYRLVNDNELWVSKFKTMGIWDKAKEPKVATENPNKITAIENANDNIVLNKNGKNINVADKAGGSKNHEAKAETYNKGPRNNRLVLSSLLNDPLCCLDNVVRSKKAAKIQLIKIYKSLSPYYDDLLLNKSYDKLKIFEDFDTPEDQSKILRNLLSFNKIDTNDTTRNLVKDKINALLELLENALLRELDIHYDLQDYQLAKKFVNILIDLQNQQTLTEFYLQKVLFGDEKQDIFDLEKFDVKNYFTNNEMNNDAFNELIIEIASSFNEKSKIIDQIFSPSVPMMYKVCEELIANQLTELIMIIIDYAKKCGVYLQAVPYIYEKITVDFIKALNSSENVGESYHELVRELIDMSFDTFATEYTREELSYFKGHCTRTITDWNQSLSKQEAETSENIWKHVKVETKNDFLSSFKKVFITNKSSNSSNNEQDENYSEIQAKAKILSENIKSLTRMLSPELVLESLNDAKISLHRLLRFKEFSIQSVRNDVFATMQDIFINIMDTIGNEHIKPGFLKALTYLQTYNPNSPTFSETQNEGFAKPLVLFFELINMADLIIQMVDIFYKEEMLSRNIIKHENSILNPSLQNKKKLEALVDKYVADGLNIGIEILVNEIDGIYKEYSSPEDYNPKDNSSITFGPTEAAKRTLLVLEENIDLLTDSADKSIVEVFQQEIAERFFQIIVKNLKQSTISVNGATNLISDLNCYYDFIALHIKANKRMIMPLYQSLKNIGSMYLISGDDAKAIGKLVSDLSKFNGIFGQEEIYEFVQRRQDWQVIKRHVEKVMYGFGLADCKLV